MPTLETLLETLQADLHSGNRNALIPEYVFGSDLMSDVLTLEDETPMLITGLANTQSIRTAEMADIEVVVIARGKEVTPAMIELAEENEIILLSSPYSLYKICGILYQNGMKALY